MYHLKAGQEDQLWKWLSVKFNNILIPLNELVVKGGGDTAAVLRLIYASFSGVRPFNSTIQHMCWSCEERKKAQLDKENNEL